MYRSYLDWIEKYIAAFRDSYVMEESVADKAAKITSMLEMYNYLVAKTKSEGLELPVNGKIIGRNKDLYAIESVFDEQYKMTLWAHLTYTLPNLPALTSNHSLPKEQFKFGNPTGIARYFISMSKSEMLEENPEINTELTTYTLELDSKQPLRLKFSLPEFSE